MGFEREVVIPYGLGPFGVIEGWKNLFSVNFNAGSSILEFTYSGDDALRHAAVSVYVEQK